MSESVSPTAGKGIEEEEEEQGGLNSFSLRTKHSGNHPGEPNRAEGGGVGETLS